VPTLQETIAIGAPIERVFERLSQAERAPEWTPNLVRVERTSAIEAGPGLETIFLVKVAGRDSHGTGICRAWDPPRSLVLESTLDIGVNSTTTFELSDAGAGTRLVARVEYSLPPKGLGKLVGGLVGQALARRDLKKALANLKQQLEMAARAGGAA
jgi:uncharacterized protein YndB with AHSA1/START domain